MRLLSGAVFFICGCQLLPHTDISCADTDRCPPNPDMAQSVDMAPVSTKIVNGFVLGQPNPQTNWLMTGFGNVKGVAILPGQKLAVADQDNHRVLIWNTFPTKNQQLPDLVIGQPDFSVGIDTFSSTTFPQTSVRSPTRMTSDGSNLIIATDNESLTSTQPLSFWNTIPTSTFAAASFLINLGASPVVGARTFIGASPLVSTGKLFLTDRQFNRLLIWNSVPMNNTTDASLVLGQTNFMGSGVNAGGLSGSSLNLPDGPAAVDGGKLFVPDTGNNRVLVWNALPTTNGQASSFVLGQASATANSVNRGAAASLAGMSSPTGVAAAMGKLVVADRYNHRVLLWNSIPTAMGQAADLVLGQTSGSGTGSNPGGTTANGMSEPLAVATDGTRIVVADTWNYRVMIWNSWPPVSGTAADVVLGQPDFFHSAYAGGFVTDSLMVGPTAIARAGNRLIVLDGEGSRALIWQQLPLDSSTKPTVVVGQADMRSMIDNAGGTSGSSLNQPRDLSSDGNVLAIADTYNNRVLIWNSIPAQNFQSASVVIGQASFVNSGVNSGGASLGMNGPRGVHVYKNRLFVSDCDNNRVLIWNSIPTTNQQAPDVVLGQLDLTKVGRNRGQAAPDASTLDGPRGLAVDDAHVYVADERNGRVLIWNTSTPKTGQAADVVLGASDFVTSGSFSSVRGLHVAGTRLYAADYDKHRVLVWNTIPVQNGQLASSVLGQTSPQNSTANAGGLGLSGLQSPYGVLDTEAGLYIVDGANARIVALPPTR